ncbi:unnamed protein product, partial [Sphacelaria rigidula]
MRTSLRTVVFSEFRRTGCFSNKGLVSFSTVIGFLPSKCHVLCVLCVEAETNRHPCDLAESAAALVSGYDVDYSVMGNDYVFRRALSQVVQDIARLPVLSISSVPERICAGFEKGIFVEYFTWIRDILRRPRFDQRMTTGWKRLPLQSSVFLVFDTGLLVSDNFLI